MKGLTSSRSRPRASWNRSAFAFRWGAPEAGFGAAGYATRRDLSGLARTLVWALIGLIVAGLVLVFVDIPHGALAYTIVGLVIFAGLTAFDFQRLRRADDIRTAPLLAAAIFLDLLNVFLLLLSLFSGED
mgnify:CR=1 FL=1